MCSSSSQMDEQSPADLGLLERRLTKDRDYPQQFIYLYTSLLGSPLGFVGAVVFASTATLWGVAPFWWKKFSSIFSNSTSVTFSTCYDVSHAIPLVSLQGKRTGSSNMYGRRGTIPIPTVVGPHRFIVTLLLLANCLPAYLTAV